MMIINKKNLLLVVFLSANSFLCVHGMKKSSIPSSLADKEMTEWIYKKINQLESFIRKDYYASITEDVLVKESTKLKNMAPAVKTQILEAQKKRDTIVQNCTRNSLHDFEKECAAWAQYRKNLASIASNPDNLMSKHNRLQCFLGDNYFDDRKSIIQSMIENDSVDPNDIHWGLDFHGDIFYPLDDSTTRKDIHFTNYLFVHGARPRYQDLCETSAMYKRVCSDNAFKNLFLKYKVMFYRISDFGHIIPNRGHIQVKDLTENLLNLINTFKKVKKDKTLFTMSVIHKSGLDKIAENIIQAMRNAGFEVSYMAHEVTHLIYKIQGQ